MRKSILVLLVISLMENALQGQCPITVDAGEDIWLCQVPASVQLNGAIYGSYLNFSWSPTAGMQGANTLNPTVTVNGPATFVLTGRSVDLNNNLIENGDFEGGNYGFTSDYTYSPTNLVPEGTYAILNNPQSAHSGFAPCGDHTSGGGNMMVVNGAGTPGLNVWCQTVSIQPNTQYVFSAWVTSVHSSSPARLQFSINGTPIGPIFTAPSTTCTWLNFYTTWNSGSNTTANICILNQNTTLGGNDFALDDIVFSPVCTVTDTVRVHVVQLQAVAAPAISVIPCEGSPITLNGNGSSTGPNISYLWETGNGNIVSGETSLQPVVNAAGAYTLNVIFNNGFVECVRTATVNVIPSNNPLTAWIGPTQPLGCGNSSVQLRGFTNQPAFAQYQWSAGPGGHFISKPDSAIVWVDQPGIYTLTVTNTMTGCTAQATVTVVAATEAPVAIASASVSEFYCTTDTFDLSGVGSSEGPTFTHHWQPLQGGRIVSGSDSLHARANAPGLYVLQVTNTTNGCITYDTVVVADKRILPVLSIDTPAVFTCTTDTVWLYGHVDSGAVRIAWQGLGGAPFAGDTFSATVGALAPGIYVLVATDTLNFCIATDTVEVLADTLAPLAQIAPPETLTCQQPEIVLVGTGSSEGDSYAYHWRSADGGNLVGPDTLLNARANAPGTYFLRVTDVRNGCTAEVSATVIADADIVVAVANAPEVLTCARTTVLLNADGSTQQPGLQYLWTTSDGLLLAGANTPTPTAGASGTYTLRITNPANGCTASDEVFLNQDTQPPLISIADPPVLTCQTTTLMLQGQATGTGSLQYEWTASDGGNIINGAQTPTPAVNAAGTYTLAVLNTDNGCSSTLAVVVSTDTVAPVAHLVPALPITCAEPVRILDGSGSSLGPGFAYLWSADVGGRFVGGTDGPTPAVDAAGTYTLTVINTENGCTQSASVSVGLDTLRPPADAGPGGLLTCAEPIFTLSANAGQTGSYQYLWQSTDGSFVGAPHAPTVNTTQAGTYVLQVTDPQNGCTSTSTAQVLADQTPPIAEIVAQQMAITCAQPALTLRAEQTQPSWQLLWTTTDGHITSPSDAATIWVNAAGTYFLLVTNPQNGCTASNSLPISMDTMSPVVAIAPPKRITCAQPETVLSAHITDAGADFSFTWIGPDHQPITSWSTLQPVTMQGGQYALHVTSIPNGCTSTASVIVDEDKTPPVANAGQDTVLNCTHPTLTLSGTAQGMGPVLLQWAAANGGHILSGANTLTPVIDAPGTYTLVVTDAQNGCSAISSLIVVADQDAPQAFIAPADTLTCARRQIALQGNGAPTASVSAIWTAEQGGRIVAGASGFSPEVDAPGRYVLTVINNQNGCTATAEVVVGQDTMAPAITVPTPPTLTCTLTTVALMALPDTAAFAYQWQTLDGHLTSGANSAQATANQSGVYVLTATDLRTGCSAQRVAVVGTDTISPRITIATPPVLTCAVTQVSIQAAITNLPAALISAQWNTANGMIVSGIQTLTPTVAAPSNYTLTAQNTSNGCTAISTITVTQDTAAPQAHIATPLPITCARRQVTLDASASAGRGALTYSWAGPVLVSGQGTATPVVGQPGTYALSIADEANGCTAVALVTVPADTAAPVANIAPPPPFTCARTAVVIDATASSGQVPLLVQWSTTGGQIASGHNTLAPTVSAPGSYILLLTNGPNGCTSTASAVVQEDRMPPVASAGPDQTLYCQQPEAILIGQSTTPGPLSFHWTVVSGGPFSADSTTAQTATRSPGTYRLVVTRLSNGCTASDDVQVSEVPPPAFSPRIEQPNCHRSTGIVHFEAISGGQPPFQYAADGGLQFRPVPQFSGLAPGTYALVMRDALGCTATASADIAPPFFPKIAFASIATLDLGDSVQLQPILNLPTGQVADWQWSPAEGLSCDDCPTPWTAPLHTTRYRLRILDINGCPAEATVLVPVSRRRLLYAPNIFSPNGDGYNDRFTLYGNYSVVAIRSLQIFDRWGNLIFAGQDLRPNDDTSGWDGTFRGQKVQPGVYVWQAVVAFLDGAEEVFAGDVTIYR